MAPAWTRIERKIAELRLINGSAAAEILATSLCEGRSQARAMISKRSNPNYFLEDVALAPELWGEDKLGNPSGPQWDHGSVELDMPDGSTSFSCIEVDCSGFASPPPVQHPATKLKAADAKVGGSSEREYWAAAIADVCVQWGLGDFKPTEQKHVEQALADYIGGKFEEYPSVGSIRSRAQIVWRRIKEAEDGG